MTSMLHKAMLGIVAMVIVLGAATAVAVQHNRADTPPDRHLTRPTCQARMPIVVDKRARNLQ